MKKVERFAVSNQCYITNEKIEVEGIMLYSAKYPQSIDKGIALRYESEKSASIKGRTCVHAVIDACLDDDKPDVYQILPWNCRAWHSGGSANATYIAVEMCEPNFDSIDNEKARKMIEKAFNSAVELFAFLCLKFGLDPLRDGVILSHKEGVKKGIAVGTDNDPEKLFKSLDPKYGMVYFRQAIATKIEKYITTEYLAPRHYDRLKEYLDKVIKNPQADFNYIVSFRPAGKYSVMMLQAGAAAKPHDILDKTIKPDKITKEESKEKLLLLLYGLVATRDGSNNISGIYYADGTTLKRGNASLKEFIKTATEIKEEDLDKLDKMSEEEILSEILNINAPTATGEKKGYAHKYIAGDYDIHDMILKSKEIPVTENSDDEFYVMNLLNQIMMGNETRIIRGTPFIKDAHYPIQHGPQYNYISHMYSEEADKELVKDVANPLLPVMAFNVDKNNKSILWTEIENIEELWAYYTKHNVNIKCSWKDFGKYVSERQGKSLYEHMKNKRVNA